MPFILALLLALAPVTAAGEDLLCRRLGGSDAVSMVVKSFLTKMRKDDADKLGRFWLHRGSDGVAREEQLIVDFVQSATGCDRLYVGRSMADTHRGMGLSAKDWDRTVDFLLATMNEFKVAPEAAEGSRHACRLDAQQYHRVRGRHVWLPLGPRVIVGTIDAAFRLMQGAYGM